MENCPLYLVVGMHRSGTSLLGSIMKNLGIAIPGELVCADTHNTKGYHEWKDIVDIQERLLIDLKRWWPALEGTLEMPQDWVTNPRTIEAYEAMKLKVGQQRDQQNTGWLIKDPRSSRLLPLWIKLDKELKLNMKIIIAVREPSEVIESLLKRDGESVGMNQKRAEALWWRHYEDILMNLPSSINFCVIDYKNWFYRPTKNLELLKELITGAATAAPNEYKALEIIEPTMNHADKINTKQLTSLATRSLYKALSEAKIKRSKVLLAASALIYKKVGDVNNKILKGSQFNELAAIEQNHQWRNYPAARVDSSIEINNYETTVISCCGMSWLEAEPHLWMQRLEINLPKPNYQIEIGNSFYSMVIKNQNTSSGIFKIALNLELPEKERANQWLNHLKDQDIIWDPQASRVQLMRSMGLNAYWFDAKEKDNGWLVDNDAVSNDWRQKLGLAAPELRSLTVLGDAGPLWNQELANRNGLIGGTEAIKIKYLPGWHNLKIDNVNAARAKAGWLMKAARSVERLIWIQTEQKLEAPVLEQVLALSNQQLILEPFLTPEDLFILHFNKDVSNIASDQIEPKYEVSIEWENKNMPTTAAVAISSFNYAGRIPKALDSVSRQTNSGIELIVVDDASTDNSVAVIKDWFDEQLKNRDECKYSRFVLIKHKKNYGLAAARNTALEHASADWCYILDADNYLLPTALEECLQVANQHQEDKELAVVHPIIRIEVSSARPDEKRSLLGGPSWQKENFESGNIVDAMALIRREAWQSVGGFTHIRGGWEDYDFWCKLIEAGWYGIQCPNILGVYRSHSDAMTYNETAKRQRSLSKVLNDRHQWLRLPLAK